MYGHVNSAKTVINAPVETKGSLSSLFNRPCSYAVNTSAIPKFHRTLRPLTFVSKPTLTATYNQSHYIDMLTSYS